METLTSHEIFSNSQIVTETTNALCKNGTWFVTFFFNDLTERSDAEIGLQELKNDLESIEGKKNKDKKLKCALINAEMCPTTGRLHFHMCPTFHREFKALPTLKKLFPGAKILAVEQAGVDTVRKYCSKNENRVGDTLILAEAPDDEIALRKQYVGKWDGRVIRKDSVLASLEREARLKQGRKNDSEKNKAIKLREKTIEQNTETMRSLFGKPKQKLRWESLRDEIKLAQQEIKRLNQVKPGEPIYGLFEDEKEEDITQQEWPDEEENKEPYEEEDPTFGTIEGNPRYLTRSTMAYKQAQDELDLMIQSRMDKLDKYPQYAEDSIDCCSVRTLGLIRQIDLLTEESIHLCKIEHRKRSLETYLLLHPNTQLTN